MSRYCRCTWLAADCAQHGICRLEGRRVHCRDCGAEVDADDELHTVDGDDLCASCFADVETEADTERAPAPEGLCGLPDPYRGVLARRAG